MFCPLLSAFRRFGTIFCLPSWTVCTLKDEGTVFFEPLTRRATRRNAEDLISGSPL